MGKKRATYAVLALCLATTLMLARSGNGAFAQGALPRTAAHALPVAQAPWNVELVGQIGGAAYAVYAVVVEWPHAYIGLGRGLVILDVSDPARPRWVGQSEVLPHVVEDVAVSGGMAYVVDEDGLRIIDVSNLAAPRQVGACETPGQALGVAVSGNMAYVVGYVWVCLPIEDSGCYHRGWLRIIDISDPAAPHEVGACDTCETPPFFSADVAVSGNIAYVAAGWERADPWWGGLNGVRMIDVSDPAAPHEVGACETPLANGVAVSGSMVYVAAGPGGLRIIDVSNPAAPDELGTYETLGWACDVAVSGTMAYVAAGSGGLRIIDVSNAAAPREVGACETSLAHGVAVSGGVAYVADRASGLAIMDVSDPAAPHEVGVYQTPQWECGCAVAVLGRMVYVTYVDYLPDAGEWHGGLRIIDVSNPAAPHQLGLCETPGSASDVAVSGDVAYVTAGDAGLRLIDVSNPAAPHELGAWDTPGCATDVAVWGSMAYVTDGDRGLRVIDVSELAAPHEVGAYETPLAHGVAVSGSIAYVAAGRFLGSLRIIDVSNAAAPYEVAACDTAGSPWNVAVSGTMAYVADGDLRVIDVSKPGAPREVGACETPGFANGVAVSGSTAYVTDGRGRSGGLRVIDVSEPGAPHEVGSYDTPGSAFGVAVSGTMAYVVDRDEGLFIFRVTAPRWFFPLLHGPAPTRWSQKPTQRRDT